MVQEDLFLKPKMGIIPELSIQNYETLAQQIREIVSNSLDAGASTFKLSLIPTTNEGAEMVLEDNGDGMSIEDLKNEFLGLGGSQKYDDESKIGRIGIGFLSVVPLCKKLEIITRKKGTNTAIIAELDCEAMKWNNLRTKEIKDIKIGKIIDITDDADSLNMPKKFTKLRLIDINDKVESIFNNKDALKQFSFELSKILPIEYNPEEPLFKIFSENFKNKLLKCNKTNYLKFYLNNETPMYRNLYNNIDNIESFQEIISEKINDSMKITGYFLATKGIAGIDWAGLNLRVLNVAVEHQSFMGLQGYEERKKIVGEFYIEGIDKNNAISINRNKFTDDNLQVIELTNFFKKKLMESFKGVNSRWQVKSILNKEINKIKATNEITEDINNMFTHIAENKKQKVLIEKEKKDLSSYKPKNFIEEISLTDKYKNISIKEGDSDSKGYNIKWNDFEGLKGDVTINKELFSNKIIKLEDKNFECVYVNGNDNDSPCQISTNDSKIFFNTKHPLVKDFNKDTLMFVLITEYVNNTSNTKDEMYNKLLTLITEYIKLK